MQSQPVDPKQDGGGGAGEGGEVLVGVCARKQLQQHWTVSHVVVGWGSGFGSSSGQIGLWASGMYSTVYANLCAYATLFAPYLQHMQRRYTAVLVNTQDATSRIE